MAESTQDGLRDNLAGLIYYVAVDRRLVEQGDERVEAAPEVKDTFRAMADAVLSLFGTRLAAKDAELLEKNTRLGVMGGQALTLTEERDKALAEVERLTHLADDYARQAADLRAQLEALRASADADHARLHAELQGCYADLSAQGRELGDWQRAYGRTFDRLVQAQDPVDEDGNRIEAVSDGD